MRRFDHRDRRRQDALVSTRPRGGIDDQYLNRSLRFYDSQPERFHGGLERHFGGIVGQPGVITDVA